MNEVKHFIFVFSLIIFHLQPWIYPFEVQYKSKHTLGMMINGFEMSTKNDDDLWEAIIYRDLNRLCSQMLKTEMKANMVNTSEDDPPFPYFYFCFQ